MNSDDKAISPVATTTSCGMNLRVDDPHWLCCGGVWISHYGHCPKCKLHGPHASPMPGRNRDSTDYSIRTREAAAKKKRADDR